MLDFTQLIKKYQEPLYWHLRRLVVNHEDARDLLQESLLQAWQKLDTLRDEGAVRSWLYRIATHAAYRHLQRHRIHPLSTEELSDMLLERLQGSSYVDYEDEGLLRFQQAILTLSEQQRTVFTLRYYDEMSYEEIARVVDSTPQSCRVAYHNATKRIQTYLEE
ncbi:MAG: RNA polymerase sigma factor [Rikenellaceae bacterium]|nr:RNA polymerase sigma factor [Rikenellaceae bacterium]